MHLPHAQRLTGHVPASQLPSDPIRPPLGHPSQRQLPLGLVPTGDLALVRERIRKDALDKWDALTPRDQIRLHNGRVWFPEAAQSDFAASLRPTPWATSQFCQRLGIPAAYFKKCPPRLQDLQFNYWIRLAQGHPDAEENYPSGPDRTDDEAPPENINSEDAPSDEPDGAPPSDTWLLRMKGDTLRGVLSSRYARLDHDLLLDCLAPLIPQGFAVDWFSLDEGGLHLRLCRPPTKGAGVAQSAARSCARWRGGGRGRRLRPQRPTPAPPGPTAGSNCGPRSGKDWCCPTKKARANRARPVSVWSLFMTRATRSHCCWQATFGKNLNLSAYALWRLYRDRWAIEQLPLSAKPMLGTERAFVFGAKSRFRLPELALLAGSVLSLAGSVLSYVAATSAPVASGFWDRAARPTCGRLRRALVRMHCEHYEELPVLGEQLRKKNSVTRHLKKGIASHKRHKAEHAPSSVAQAAQVTGN